MRTIPNEALDLALQLIQQVLQDGHAPEPTTAPLAGNVHLRTILEQLEQAHAFAHRIAAGDFSQPLDESSGLNQDLNRAAESIARDRRLHSALVKIVEASSAAVDQNVFFELVCQAMRSVISFSTFAIALLEPGSQDLRLAYYADERGRPAQVHAGALQMLTHIVRLEQPLLASEVQELITMMDDSLEKDQLDDFRSFLGAPLRPLDGNLSGVVALHRNLDQNERFTEDDRQALNILSSQVAGAIERWHTETALQAAQRAFRESEKRLRTVLSNSPVVMFALDRQGIFQLSEGQALQALGLAPDEVVGASVYDIYREYPTILAAFERALKGEMVETEVQLAELLFDTWYAPMVDTDGQITGVIGVATNITDRMRNQVRRTALYQALQEMGASLDINQVAGVIHRAAATVMPVDVVVMALLEEETRQVDYVYLFDAGVNWPRERVPLGRGLASHIILSGRTLHTDDINDPALSAETGALDFGSVPTAPLALLAVPMRLRDRVIGMISLQAFYPTRYAPEDLELLEMLAAYAAPAFENARLYEEARRRSDQLQNVYRTGMAITATLEWDQVLRTIYNQCQMIVNMDRFYIAVVDEMNGMVEYPLLIDHGRALRADSLHSRMRGDLVEEVVRSRQTIYRSFSLSAHPKPPPKRPRGVPKLVSFLGIPLFARDQVMGVLAFHHGSEDAYRPDQIQLLETISTQAAVALENARMFRQIERLAITDGLTGVFTRRHAFSLAEQEFRRARRYRKPMALIIFDVDLFRNFNEAYGHLVGDQVLISVTAACRQDLRQPDIFGRYGGEEFLIVLPETNLEQAVGVAERLRSRVAGTFVESTSGRLNVTISLGVTEFESGDAGFESMVARADQALYHSKHTGRNRVSSKPGD